MNNPVEIEDYSGVVGYLSNEAKLAIIRRKRYHTVVAKDAETGEEVFLLIARGASKEIVELFYKLGALEKS